MIADRELPALCRAADSAAGEAQRAYLKLTRWTLFLLFIGSLLAALASVCDQWRAGIAVLGAVVFVVSIVLNSIINTRNPEKVWYGSRAVAESVKTLAWRYMAGAEPFPLAKPTPEADHDLAQRLKGILQERQQLAFALASPTLAEPQITDAMRQLRAATFAERRSVYLQKRVLDQQSWYSTKAAGNQRSATKYFVLTTTCQILAVSLAILAAARPDIKLSATGLLATVASGLIAWTQVKQYSNLAQSYAVAAIELGIIHDQGAYLHDDSGLAAFVADAENAISREHTLWVARRDRT